MHRSRPLLTLATVALAAVTLTGCAGDLREASASASPSASATVESHRSETTPVTEAPEPSETAPTPYIPTPELTDDFEADIVRYWPTWADLKPSLAQEFIDDFCESSLDDGLNSFYSVDEALAMSSFHSEVSSLGRYGEEDWMIPQVIVHHQCPERTKHVQVVVRFEYVHDQENATED